MHEFGFWENEALRPFEDLRRFLDVFQRLMPEVGVIQFRVVTAMRQQFVMRPLLDDPAVAQHDDPVSVLDG